MNCSRFKGLKRSHPGQSEETSASLQGGEAGQGEDGLRVWGYMPGHVHFKVGAVDDVSAPLVQKYS